MAISNSIEAFSGANHPTQMLKWRTRSKWAPLTAGSMGHVKRDAVRGSLWDRSRLTARVAARAIARIMETSPGEATTLARLYESRTGDEALRHFIRVPANSPG
jgi:hypothetical protein